MYTDHPLKYNRHRVYISCSRPMQTLRLSKAERDAMGERVRAARSVSGLTLRDVAADLGVSTNSVSQWEHGALPSPAKRAELAHLYDVAEARLFAEYFALVEEARAILNDEPAQAS
jgi:transcriptional regulator with XRE-family HTH domain